MRKIPVSELKPGMAFSKPVYLDPENILVKADEPISSADIERLTKWSITEVETAGEIIEVPEQEQNSVGTAHRPDASEKEIEEIDEIKDILKKTVKHKTRIKKMFIDGEDLLKDGYTALANEKPFQVSRFRTLAENVSAMLDDAPNMFIYTYYNRNEASLFHHVMTTAAFGGVLGAALGFSKPRVIELIFSILLMKVGMLQVPEEIRNKKGQLDDAEKQKLHAHPLHGYQLLTQKAKVKNSIAIVALQHHEHYDGSGYPRQIKGGDTSDYTKVAAIADSFSALLEFKVYRATKMPYEAMKELVTLGVYRYDPIYLKAFLDRLSIYPIGSVVQLSDNTHGIVVGSVIGKPMRPVLLLLREADGRQITEPMFLHLLYHTDKYISQALDPIAQKMDLEKELSSLVAKL